MGRQMHILLYGDSIILGSVGASLARMGRFHITHLSAPLPGPSDLEALAPDVILFDAENGQPDPAFSVLKTRPGLRLLSINPDGNVVQLWSGHEYRELSTTDLTDLIVREAAPSVQASRKGAG
jgi:hypothetical protein